ncbi:hypothetical protein NP590_06310 [Methylomonas sp. SURF-2]|uniref:Uncharacterized protein n=1 Tax=Methylomonas subterranea TaxID=2952225 RepID=A0ABT1TEP0_9GAMM|nr:hypothetical protein [Methylomonas sp. SURF-2]MCQ8103711.1 hypothetical protein [Methylomonas sp. SURF-2]
MTAMQDQSLIGDGQFEQALKRVVFEPGMLLGVEATSSEQDYHRRRLVRHQYWLHGYGTLSGLVVSLEAEEAENADQHIQTKLMVSPGIGIDGLGREVSSHEAYCINLKDWLEAHCDKNRIWQAANGGFDGGDNSLWLKVVFRYQEQPSALQPVMATKLNAGTDPVRPSRLKDCILLDLIAEKPLIDDPVFAPWGPPAYLEPLRAGHLHGRAPEDPAAALNPEEQTYLTAHADNGGLLNLNAAMLHALGAGKNPLDMLTKETLAAQTLLARIRIQLDADRKVVSNPGRIQINNLLRPFVTTPEQLISLHRSLTP